MKLFFEEILVRFGFLILEGKNNNKRFKSKMNFIYIPLLFPNSKAKTDHTDRRRRRNIICSKRKKERLLNYSNPIWIYIFLEIKLLLKF